MIINNVGMSYDHPDYLETCDSEMLWKMIHINVVPATLLTKVFLPGMAKKKKGKTSAELIRSHFVSVMFDIF